MRPIDDTQEPLERIEAAAARGAATALAARPKESPGWQAIAVFGAILGSIVWFGIDFSGRLGRMEGQLTILMQAVQDGRSVADRGEVPVLRRGAPTAPGDNPPQNSRNRPGS